MTLKKHLFGTVPPENHYVRRIHIPLALVLMIFTPIAGWVILGVIAVIVLTSAVTEILLLFAAYTALVVLLNALALGIEGRVTGISATRRCSSSATNSSTTS